MTMGQMQALLAQASEPTVKKYMKTVVSDTRHPMLFVPMQPLRQIAKEAAKGDWLRLTEGPFECYEQVLCVGLAVAYAKASLTQRLEGLRRMMPYFDSWAMTDSVFPTLRFMEDEKPLLWDFALECIKDPGEYAVRSGVVILLRFFITEAEMVAAVLQSVRDERYYVQMAVAWCFAEMAVDHYEIVEKVLETGELSQFIHNKTIQKIRESYRIPREKKEAALRLRRK